MATTLYQYAGGRVRVINIVIVINCNLMTFSDVFSCKCNLDISLITVIESN